MTLLKFQDEVLLDMTKWKDELTEQLKESLEELTSIEERLTAAKVRLMITNQAFSCIKEPRCKELFKERIYSAEQALKSLQDEFDLKQNQHYVLEQHNQSLIDCILKRFLEERV